MAGSGYALFKENYRDFRAVTKQAHAGPYVDIGWLGLLEKPSVFRGFSAKLANCLISASPHPSGPAGGGAKKRCHSCWGFLIPFMTLRSISRNSESHLPPQEAKGDGTPLAARDAAERGFELLALDPLLCPDMPQIGIRYSRRGIHPVEIAGGCTGRYGRSRGNGKESFGPRRLRRRIRSISQTTHLMNEGAGR